MTGFAVVETVACGFLGTAIGLALWSLIERLDEQACRDHRIEAYHRC